MEAHSYVFSKIISSDLGADEHYHVPKYQREYTWGKRNWEQLMHDIDENPKGYFMGSIICVSESVLPGHEKIYQVIDGQQRLTTLSLLLNSQLCIFCESNLVSKIKIWMITCLS